MWRGSGSSLHLLEAELVNLGLVIVADDKHAPRDLRHSSLLIRDDTQRLVLVFVWTIPGGMPRFAAVKAQSLLLR